MSAIHIVFATDVKFLPHMGVALISILMNAGEKDLFHFHVISEGLPEEEKERVRELMSIRNSDLSFVDFRPDSKFCRFEKISPNFSKRKVYFYRIFIGSLLPGICRVLYLDSDIVVRGSIKELWDTEMGSATIGAVEEMPLCKGAENDRIALGLERYFNSGVLLVDLVRWRERSYEKEILNINEDVVSKAKFYDQSLLNYSLSKDVFFLDRKWNFLTCYSREYYGHCFEKNGIFPEPKIIHYASRKPWNFDTKEVPFAEEYWKYRAMSPWKWQSDAKWYGQVAKHCWRHPRDAVFWGLKKIGSGFKGQA